MGDRCGECGKWTDEGRKRLAERAKNHPIYGTDFEKPLSVLVEELRNQISQMRGQLSDIRSAFPAWGERTAPVEGLLTCGLVTLYDVREELRKYEADVERHNVELTGVPPTDATKGG